MTIPHPAVMKPGAKSLPVADSTARWRSGNGTDVSRLGGVLPEPSDVLNSFDVD